MLQAKKLSLSSYTHTYIGLLTYTYLKTLRSKLATYTTWLFTLMFISIIKVQVRNIH